VVKALLASEAFGDALPQLLITLERAPDRVNDLALTHPLDFLPMQLLLMNGTFRSLPTGHRPLRCPGRLRQGSFEVGQDEHEHRNAEEQSQRGQ
jgi:hypothetical protein